MAEALGYHPEVILAGRRINDGRGTHVAGRLVRTMLRRGLPVNGGRFLVMGLTFRENCPDLRNTRVVDVIAELRDHGMQVVVHAPWVDAQEARHEFGIGLVAAAQQGTYDAVLLAVAHGAFRDIGAEGVGAFGRTGHLLFDLKSVFPALDSDWRL